MSATDDLEIQVNAAEALKLVVGLLGALRAKRVLDDQALELVFENALTAAEGEPSSAATALLRQRLERLAAQVSALPEIQSGSTPHPDAGSQS